jgi:hypothetical protein
VQLAHEELDRPEIGAAVREVCAPAVAQLVVKDDRPANAREIAQRQQLVVHGAWAAVKHHQWRRTAHIIRM